MLDCLRLSTKMVVHILKNTPLKVLLYSWLVDLQININKYFQKRYYTTLQLKRLRIDETSNLKTKNFRAASPPFCDTVGWKMIWVKLQVKSKIIIFHAHFFPRYNQGFRNEIAKNYHQLLGYNYKIWSKLYAYKGSSINDITTEKELGG